ncbi:MAG: GDP-mannose 6-dehydrogenase [Fibrobacteres bacterium]|nr:GDP-mannose 6-dehydrogenase [Fibrobacterota bacterium]
MRISIVGSGYVGLVTGACLAEKGHKVVCVDLDARKVRNINAGASPIHERGLGPLLRRNAGNRLRAIGDLKAAVQETDLTIVAVGTPFDGHGIDLTQIREACASIGRALREKSAWHMVVIKSTVVPGTTENEVLPILERESGKIAGEGFGVGMNPEFLTEGEAVEDFMRPDRLVLGAIDRQSMKALEELYDVFPGVERIRVNCRTAEMIKYASNALLATLISFSNEIANLCSNLGGVDAMDVVKGVQASKYLSVETGHDKSEPAPIADFLVPGCGFGGSCLPKDISALIAHGKAAGASMRVLEAVRDTNMAQPARVARLLEKHLHDLRGVPVTVLGLAFRPGTSDMRESPAIPIIRDLLARGARVSAFDPALVPAATLSPAVASASAMLASGSPGSVWEDSEEREKIHAPGESGFAHESPGGDTEADRADKLFNGQVRLCRSLEEAVAGARGIVLVTRWHEFRRLPALLETAVGQEPPVFVDGRRMLDKAHFRVYEGIGL